MKIIANGYKDVILDFSDSAQWLSMTSGEINELNFIEKNDNSLILSLVSVNNISHMIKINSLLCKYLKDTNKKIKWDGEIYESFKEKLIIAKNTQEKIQESYIDVLNNNFELKQLNEECFKDDFTPYDFQNEHAKQIISKVNSANFSSPGAGKTIIAYMAAASLFVNNEINDIVVFGPKSAQPAWAKEWEVVLKEEYVDSRNIDYLNFSKKKSKEIKSIKKRFLSNQKLNIWFINFHKLNDQSFVNILQEKIKERKYLLIIDEAHYIKNTKGKWYKELKSLSISANYSLILTGTPIPRFAHEGHYLINVLWPEVKHKGLEKENFETIGEKEDFENLKNNFRKIFSRKNKDSLLKEGALKKLNKIDIIIKMNDVEKFLIDSIKIFSPSILDEKTIQKLNKALLIRLMQASSYPVLLKTPLEDVINELREELTDINEEGKEESEKYHKEEIKMLHDAKHDSSEIEKEIQTIINSSKISNLINSYKTGEKIPYRWIKAFEIIEENNENIIVWDIFRKSMKDFHSYLREKTNREIFVVNGLIIGQAREKNLENFKKHKNAILIASPATIAESVSLHKTCHIAIYLYKNYVGSHWMQSIDRIHRLVSPGDKSSEKTIYNIMAEEGSIDETIMKNLNEKERQQSKLID